MNLISVIECIVSEVELTGVKSLQKYIDQEKVISNEIIKCTSSINGIESIIVVMGSGKPYEITFNALESDVGFKQVEDRYGDIDIGYNFRENYTEFSIEGDWNNILNIFFILDNKYFEDRGGFFEKTPEGIETYHQNVFFDCFCLRLKN